MASELKALAQLIVKELDELDAAYVSRGQTFPSFDDPDAPPAIQDPSVIKHSELALAAASKLVAELKRPDMSIMQAAMGMFDSAALGVVVEANIVEILRDAGPGGLHIKEIGKRAGLDVNKLARCLRHITTTRHIFREGPADYFSNNRLSGSMDTKKPLESLKSRDVNRYLNAKGIAPLIGHTCDEVFRGAAEIPDLVTNPETSSDENPAHAPMLIGNHSPSGSMFEFFEEPKNDWRFARFHAAMAGLDLPKDHVVTAYDWGSLKEGSLVVDVGGGAGGPLNVLAQAHKHLKYVLQDRPVVIAAAEKHLKNVYPGAVESGLISLQEHDFFTPQPLKNVAVFMLRFITHNWPNAHASKILACLRGSATPDTRVVLIEHIVKHACSTKGMFADVPGAEDEEIPEILQGNMGAAEVTAGYDLQMYTILNAQERTVGMFSELAQSAGWKLHSIVRGHSHADNLIILAPA